MRLGICALGALGAAPACAAGTPPLAAGRADACQRLARRYEERCLMPRIEARVRVAEDGDASSFVGRMRDIDVVCAEVTAGGLAGCAVWPRVRPTAEYRRWLEGMRESWERRQVERDDAQPACPPGVFNCL
ncbi:MAG TPA: hypothetical protein VNO26_03935 [Candidatus Limnocylindria bacterium]|nr:hypothetical protein [Candidatus Limnocylindria bacterium]